MSAVEPDIDLALPDQAHQFPLHDKWIPHLWQVRNSQDTRASNRPPQLYILDL